MFEAPDDGKKLYFYNSSGVRQGAKVFMSNEERTEFLEGVASDMTEYVGAECYTEPIPETLDLAGAEIIP